MKPQFTLLYVTINIGGTHKIPSEVVHPAAGVEETVSLINCLNETLTHFAFDHTPC
jgi:hypothetical protein